MAEGANLKEGEGDAVSTRTIAHGSAHAVVLAPVAEAVPSQFGAMAEGANPEEAEGDAEATRTVAHGSARIVVLLPVAEVVPSQFGAIAEGANPEGDAEATKLEGRLNPELAEGVTETELGGAHDVAVAPVPEVVSSQEKPGRTEKGKAIAAQVDFEGIPFKVGERVSCSNSQGDNHRTAEVVDWKESRPGWIKYYVHYIGSDKRLDEWLPWTRVEKLSEANLSPLKSPSVTPISRGEVGSGTSATTGTPTRYATRNSKRRLFVSNILPKSTEELPALDQSLEKEHQKKTKVKNIQVVWLGEYEIDSWYYSPYPDEYHVDRLHICEFCLKYMRKKETLEKHKMKCELKYPPGDEIYQTTAPIDGRVRESEDTDLESISSDDDMQHLSVYEVDGSKNKLYCQNLCLLAGLFLDHKTLHYEVDLFLFYILTENDSFGKHLVAYFSKEKDSEGNCNIACILTLPPFQRKRYGQFLIAFAYELSKKECKIGTPERPLSDLGLAGFTSYWKRVLLETIRDHRDASIEEITKWTSIKSDDVVSTLKPLDLVKFWKYEYVPKFDKRNIDNHLKKLKSQPDWLKIDRNKLHWPVKPPIALPTPKRHSRDRRRS